MDKFLTLTISGLATAAIFAVAASGLVLTYTTTGVFNFAHGAFGMLGAFTYWQLHVAWGWPTWLSVLIVVAVMAPALGTVIETGVMRHVQGAPETTKIVVSVGLLAGALGLGQWIWSPQESHPIQHFWEGNIVTIGTVNVTWHALFAMAVAIAVALGLRVLLFGTRTGITMRAAVDDRPLAMLNGARPDRSAMVAWAIGCSLAALSGILIAPDQGLSHTGLTLLIVNAYAAAMIGRLRSLPLTFVGAAILGLADAYAQGYVPRDVEYLTNLRTALPVIILFIVLLALPRSRLRSHTTLRSREHYPRPTFRGSLTLCGLLLLGTVMVAAMVTDADALTLTKLFAFGIIALSLVPLVGYGGQISLCQLSFAGFGAIVMSHHGGHGNPVALLYAAVVAGAVGALVALPALRLSGLYLALGTGAFAVILDRWIFLLPAFDLGPWRITLFEGNTVPVDRLHVPGVDPSSEKSFLFVVTAVFCLLAIAVVALRRSCYGERLLALRDSEAACATLGLNVRTTKLWVFALSAAIAGVGGAIYGGTLGSAPADSFSFFQNLPLLLLAVVGGLGAPAGALMAGFGIYVMPVLASTFPVLTNPNRLIPGLMGASLGQNPNGAVRDIQRRLDLLRTSRAAQFSVAAAIGGLAALELGGVLSGWVFGILAFLVPFIVAQASGFTQRVRDQGDVPLEWVGIERPFTADDVRRLDAALGMGEL